MAPSRQYQFDLLSHSIQQEGVFGGAMVLSKLSMSGHPTTLDNSRARAYCACSMCGLGLFGHFFSRPSFLSFSGRRPDMD